MQQLIRYSKPVIDDNGGIFNESNDNMTEPSGETVTESQSKKVSVSDNHSCYSEMYGNFCDTL